MTTKITKCRIWGEDYEAVGHIPPDPGEVVVTESARAGGGYVIPGSVRQHLDGLDDEEKARLTTWLVDQRLQGNHGPTVTEEILKYVVDRHRLPIQERADRLLRFLSKQTTVAGNSIDLFQHSEEIDRDGLNQPIYPNMPTNPNFLAAMRFSLGRNPFHLTRSTTL